MKKALISLVALLGAQSVWATATEINQCGFQINQPGHYKVVQDLNCGLQAPYVGIMISNVQSGQVKLDLQDYKLKGKNQNGGQGIGIFINNSRNIEIKADSGARLRYFQTGIQLWNNNRNIEIDGDRMVLHQNRTAVLIRNSQNVEVKELKFQQNQTDLTLLNSSDVDMERLNRN